MAAQQGDQAAPQQQRHPVFSIWGVTHYRDDLGLTISSLQPTHPLAAVGVAALVISIAILVLVLVGWLNLTPGVLTSVVVTVLGLPQGGLVAMCELMKHRSFLQKQCENKSLVLYVNTVRLWFDRSTVQCMQWPSSRYWRCHWCSRCKSKRFYQYCAFSLLFTW